jgi:hypothetical protein
MVRTRIYTTTKQNVLKGHIVKMDKNDKPNLPIIPAIPSDPIVVPVVVSDEEIKEIFLKNSKENISTPTKPNHEYDLDVPGSELDDNKEIFGNEDEENNFYSLGSDRNED